MPGEYTEFDRWSRYVFFLNVTLHVSKQYAAHSEAMHFGGEGGGGCLGHSTQIFYFKW